MTSSAARRNTRTSNITSVEEYRKRLAETRAAYEKNRKQAPTSIYSWKYENKKKTPSDPPDKGKELVFPYNLRGPEDDRRR